MDKWISYIWYLLPIILGGWTFYMWRTGKKEKVKKVIAILVLEVGKNFIELTGTEKFDLVFDNIYNSMPKLLKLIISKKWIKQTIQKEYDRLKNYIKNKFLNPTEMAGKAVDLLVDKAVNVSYNRDKKIVSNEQLKAIKSEVKQDVIYGNIKLKSDLKRNNNLVAELGFNKSF